MNSDKNSISFFGGPYKAYGLAQFDFFISKLSEKKLVFDKKAGRRHKFLIDFKAAVESKTNWYILLLQKEFIIKSMKKA